MNGRFQKINNRINKFFHGFYIGMLFVGLVAWSCDYYYFGKSRDEINEELSQTIFEADSLLMSIERMLDSATTRIDGTKVNDYGTRN